MDAKAALLPGPHRVHSEPARGWFASIVSLVSLSVILHVLLVLLHCVLFGVWWKRLEHQATFPLEKQTIASLVITAVTTSFGTLYCAALVFVTQRLFRRKNLQALQTLTETHNNAAAWDGIASALLALFDERTTATSSFGVLSAFLYLASIAALHVSTPALFALETFNASSIQSVNTLGFPVLNLSGYDLGVADGRAQAWADAVRYSLRSLYFLPYVSRTDTNIGLANGTIYDALAASTGVGNASVAATGIIATCGYLKNVNITFTNGSRTAYIAGSDSYVLDLLSAGPVFSATRDDNGVSNGFGVIFYTTSDTTILDSSGNAAPPASASVTPQSEFSALLQCAVTIVDQTAIVDVQSRLLLEMQPNVVKNESTWRVAPTPIQGPQNFSDPFGTEEITLVDLWQGWYTHAPLDPELDESVSDLYLNQQLASIVGNSTPSTIRLNDLENALANTVAALYWTLGNIEPLSGDGSTAMFEITLPEGSAAATNMSAAVRLDLSLIPVSVGLLASVILALLSLQYIRGGTGHQTPATHLRGTGLLHAIWLYRNHPELETILEHVDVPTEQNLAEAGMIVTRFVNVRRDVEKMSARSGSQRWEAFDS